MKRLGFFAGTAFGMFIPLMLLGGEIQASKDTEVTDTFYGGLVIGILLDIALIVGLVLLFRK